MAITVPGAQLMLANPVSTRRVLPWWIYCHTIVGSVTGALPGRHYHLYVRADGSFVQRQDLALRSAASVQMNPYSIAIVAEDKGPAFPSWSGSNVPAYTDAQVKTLILIISWICRRFGIPTSAVRTSCLNERHGVAWHRLGIDGNFPNTWPYWGRQPGCLETSLSTGKPCPGNNRIHQLVHDIVPALSAPTDWFDMATQAQLEASILKVLRSQLPAIAKAVWDLQINDVPGSSKPPAPTQAYLRWANHSAGKAVDLLEAQTPPTPSG